MKISIKLIFFSLIREDHRLGIYEIAKIVGIDKKIGLTDFANSVFENLKMRKLCSKFVPKSITYEQNTQQ